VEVRRTGGVPIRPTEEQLYSLESDWGLTERQMTVRTVVGRREDLEVGETLTFIGS